MAQYIILLLRYYINIQKLGISLNGSWHYNLLTRVSYLIVEDVTSLV